MAYNYKEWDQYYRKYAPEELGWELGKPRPLLVEFVEKNFIRKGKTLDICCGAGTNTIYLAQKGFDVTGIDISLTAIELAKKKANEANVAINFLLLSFIILPFRDEEFDFVFDMGCFHHVAIEDRTKFIEGVHRVLKEDGVYFLTSFSNMNGPRWNHFSKKQLIDLFSGYFQLSEIRHISSVEGDGVIRYFYSLLMKRKKKK
jgi:ubiquinone/menaquinone biosynthesis C-methylase UbiE